MFILANRNIVLPTAGGDECKGVIRGFLGEVPDQFCDTPYFAALVKDGKIVIPSGHSDKAVTAAAEEGEKVLKKAVEQTRADPDQRPKKGRSKKN